MRFYLRVLTSLLLILLINTLTSCVHREEAHPISTAYFLDAISKKTGLKKNFSVTGRFSLQTESFNYAGNFFLEKDKIGIKLRVYGAFGIKAQEFQITPRNVKDTVFLYLLGYYPHVNGVILRHGTTYFFNRKDKITIKTDNDGNVLLISLKGVKIFLSNYKRFNKYKMPETILVRKGIETLSIKILKVEYRS